MRVGAAAHGFFAVLVAASIVACGTPAVPRGGGDGGATGPTFAIAPVTFLPEPEVTKTKRAELHADGVVFTDGKEVGHIKDGDVFVEPYGLWATLQEDGSLVGSGLEADEGAAFVGNTFVKRKSGTTIAIEDDGTVTATLGKDAEKKTIGKLEAPTKATRAALVLVTLGIVLPPEKVEAPIPDPPPERPKKKKPGKKPGKKPPKKR